MNTHLMILLLNHLVETGIITYFRVDRRGITVYIKK